jgi:starch phosphorylase
MATLYQQYLGPRWLDAIDEPHTWDGIAQIPDQSLWKARHELKQCLVTFVRERVSARLVRQGAPVADIEAARHLLDPEVLTIGFARRFATYKRATLIFRDLDRLRRIVNQPGRPVQLLFAGKAHPNDEPGKALIRDIYRWSQDPALKGHIAFIEEYDMCVSRAMVHGADVWLNTPRKPNEASGTSGQKAGLNGVPNASILDGWWAEAYNGKNGWAIAIPETHYSNADAQDDADARALYEVLENRIIPLYYERGDDHLPHAWLSMVKETIRTVAPAFSTRRMLKDYVNRLYLVPAGAELA